MNLECLACRRAILLGEEDRAPIRGHLERCEGCRRFEDNERAVATAVRDRAPRPAAPQALRERLVAALEAERRRTARRWWRWAGAAFLAAATALAVAGVVLLRPAVGVAEARRTVAALAADHLEYAAAGGLMEIESSSPAEITDWLRARTRLAVRVSIPPGATVVGARRCSLRGRPAGLVAYRLTGSDGTREAASLFVFQGAGEEWSSMETVATGRPKRICRAHDRGLGVLVWEDRGLTYAFVSGLPEPELRALAEHL
jgi:anti-sigma factor RsiW